MRAHTRTHLQPRTHPHPHTHITTYTPTLTLTPTHPHIRTYTLTLTPTHQRCRDAHGGFVGIDVNTHGDVLGRDLQRCGGQVPAAMAEQSVICVRHFTKRTHSTLRSNQLKHAVSKVHTVSPRIQNTLAVASTLPTTGTLTVPTVGLTVPIVTVADPTMLPHFPPQ